MNLIFTGMNKCRLLGRKDEGNLSALNQKRMKQFYFFCEQKTSNGKKKEKKKTYPLGDHAKEVTLAMAGEPGRMVELCRKFVLFFFFSHPPSAGSDAGAEAETEAGAGEGEEGSMAISNAGSSPASIAACDCCSSVKRTFFRNNGY